MKWTVQKKFVLAWNLAQTCQHGLLMEPTSDRRFDTHSGVQLLLEIAREHSVEPILNKIVEYAVERTQFVFSQVWLIKKGDLCATCKYQSECADQSRCLHLVAGGGRTRPSEGQALQPYENVNARVPLNFGPLGQAVASGHLKVIRGEGDQPVSAPGFEWLRGEGILECGIQPIEFKGEVLGAVVGFAREYIPDSFTPWGQVFADHVGAAIANARAFDEICRLKEQLELQNSYLQEAVVEAKAFGDLVGQSAPLKQVVSQIDVVAPTEASVLILGETGTGKELVAHEIHRRSARKDGPLVRVNCASIPRELFESEFFGHVRGRGPLSRRPLLPAERLSHSGAAIARAHGRHPLAGETFRRSLDQRIEMRQTAADACGGDKTPELRLTGQCSRTAQRD
jgi:formate hydrogenlyase transcriptional activator